MVEKSSTGNISFDGFASSLGIVITAVSKNHVSGTMPIDDSKRQPFGYMHGGATLAFLETIASVGGEYNCDTSTHRPFGYEVCVRHLKGAKSGTLHGEAEFDKVEGNKYYWNVVATDDVGDIISKGYIVIKLVSLERLAEIEAKYK